MAVYRVPKEWTEWVQFQAAGSAGRSRWQLLPLMLGAVFVGRRRTVTTWSRAATLQRDYRDFYHFLPTVGRRWREVGDRVLALVVRRDDPSRHRQGADRATVLLLHRPRRGRA